MKRTFFIAFSLICCLTINWTFGSGLLKLLLMQVIWLVLTQLEYRVFLHNEKIIYVSTKDGWEVDSSTDCLLSMRQTGVCKLHIQKELSYAGECESALVPIFSACFTYPVSGTNPANCCPQAPHTESEAPFTREQISSGEKSLPLKNWGGSQVVSSFGPLWITN